MPTAPPSADAGAPLNFVNVLHTMLGVSDKVSDLIFFARPAATDRVVGKIAAGASDRARQVDAGAHGRNC